MLSIVGGPNQLHTLVSWKCLGRGDNGWHGKNLTVQTETNSYHSLTVGAYGVSAALLFGFWNVHPSRCPARIQYIGKSQLSKLL